MVMVLVMVAAKDIKNDTAPVSNSAYFKVELWIKVKRDRPPSPMPNPHLLLLYHLPQLIQLLFHIRLTLCHMCLQICHLWIQTYSFWPQFTSLLETFCDHDEIKRKVLGTISTSPFPSSIEVVKSFFTWKQISAIWNSDKCKLDWQKTDQVSRTDEETLQQSITALLSSAQLTSKFWILLFLVLVIITVLL